MMPNIITVEITDDMVIRRYENYHLASFDRKDNRRMFPDVGRLQRTFAECIYLYGIVSVNDCQYIRTDNLKDMAYKGRRYYGNPTIQLDLVIDTLYTPLKDFVDKEEYQLYTVNDYDGVKKPCIVDVPWHEVNIR
jgi:hypothetical protein